MFKRENLRKNFLRVKQIADQNLGRAEKSEVLSEDQQENERRADIARQVCHNLTKKIAAILEAPPGTDAEKRLKKLPETGLSNCLIESSVLLGQDTLLGHICQMCGECEGSLAQEELHCELAIEEHVLTPLQTIAEVEIPNIMKLRKQLNKSTLDMDSAKSRFNSAVRQSHVPGANMASAAAKADAVRDEYDEAVNKVENIKDNLSIELCNFIARESERSSTLVSLLEAQAAYHKKALMAIEGMIPKMKAVIEASQEKPVFGMSLEEHLCLMKRDISFVLEVCILMLLDNGMEEEGLFRIAGAAIKSKKLRACIDAHSVDMEDFINDPHTVAGVLKQYLRELPEPLLTYNLYSDFMQATQLPVEQRLNSLQTTLNRLPPANFNNLRYLVKFLALLAEKSSLNKMTPSNIAIVIGPNLLWSRGETAPNMMTAGAVSAIIEAFIIHADRFFPGEFDFHLTGQGCAPPSLCASQSQGDVHGMSGVVTKGGSSSPIAAAIHVQHSSPLLPSTSRPLDLGTLLQIATGDSLEPVASGEETTDSERKDSSCSEPVVQGDTCLAAFPGDGFLHSPVPPTNINQVANARRRPSIPAPPPPVKSSTPVTNNGMLSSMRVNSYPCSPVSSCTPSQSLHKDMYSTMFALHSLGEGDAALSAYLTRVRALWDGQFQSSPRFSGLKRSPSLPEHPSTPAKSPAPSGRAAAVSRAESSCQGPGARVKGGKEIHFALTAVDSADSPGQEHTEVFLSSSLSAHPPVTPTSPAMNNAFTPLNDSPEAPPTSPKAQRRIAKKPAPPPPPDRSYNVAVTASVSRISGNSTQSSQTWPRSAPLASPESPPESGANITAEGDRHKHSPQERRTSTHGGERPHGPPPDRPNAPPPDRPKGPSTMQSAASHLSSVQPSGHQRSASAGAIIGPGVPVQGMATLPENPVG